jgi:plastocyanin
MNKYIIILIVLGVLVGGGVAFRSLSGGARTPISTGIVKEFTLTSVKDEWRFEPSDIEVDQGDTVILNIINQDKYDHGIAIEAYGVSQRIPALENIKIQFVATQAGEFPFYCSVPCGDGIVNGVKRGHFDQVGKLFIKALRPSEPLE